MIITIAGDAFLIEAQINDGRGHSPARLSIRLRPRRRDQTDGRERHHADHARGAGCLLGDDPENAGQGGVAACFPDKSAHDYEVESLKVLAQSLETLDRRDMLFPFSLLKFRREARKTGADIGRRKELAGEMKGTLREMEGFLSVGRSEGRLSVGGAAMTLERTYEELYGLYPECEEAKMELRERLRTRWRYLREGERRGIQLGERRAIELLEQGCALEQIKRTLAQEAGR
jgi:hypothetical protein